jgi:hypothetical protein
MEEAPWYRFKSPHPNGAWPDRFEKIPSPEARKKRDNDDAARLKSLRKKLASTLSRACALRDSKNSHHPLSSAFAAQNVLYVQTLNEAVDIQERIAALFVEQEAA